jgi:hypothetical protein
MHTYTDFDGSSREVERERIGVKTRTKGGSSREVEIERIDWG